MNVPKEELISVVQTIGVYIGAGAIRDEAYWKEARRLIIPTLEALRLHAEANWIQFEPIWQEQLEKAKLKR